MPTDPLVWYPTPGYENETVDILRSEGVQIRSGLGLEPLTIITNTLALTSLVGALIKLYRDVRNTGVLIDATSDPIEIREMPGWRVENRTDRPVERFYCMLAYRSLG